MSIDNQHKISVIMSVYNTNEAFLRKAIESILQQTYKNFEFLIFDDASSDHRVKDIIIEYKDVDNRIKYIRNDANLGLTKTLNKGIKLAKGEFIARMDSDDFSLPTRFEEQVKFLLINPEVSAAATAFYIDNDGKQKKHKIGRIKPKEIEVRLFFENSCIAHSSMMMRTDFLRENSIYYNEQMVRAQDYDMWVQIARHGRISVVNKYLTVYRMGNHQISAYAKKEQKQFKDNISLKQLADLKLAVNDNEKKIHLSLCDNSIDCNIIELKKWIKLLVTQNRRIGLFDRTIFEGMLNYRYLKILFKKILAGSSSDIVRILNELISSTIRGVAYIAKEYTKLGVYKWFNFRGSINRLFLKHKNFTVISNNCLAGDMYRFLGLPYLTPTVGLFIMAPDFIKLLGDLYGYFKRELKFIEENESKYRNYLSNTVEQFGKYPIGLLGDIEIHFLHYKSRQEARTKWNRRVERINWDYMIFKFNDQYLCTEAELKAFSDIDFPNKLCFVSKDYEEFKDVIFMKEYCGLDAVTDDIKYYKKYINIIKYINSIKKTNNICKGKQNI